MSLACPNNINHVQHMEKLLKERIFGQDEAIKMIITAFKAHDKTKPLTFHFAGGMGLGKRVNGVSTKRK
jgi:ATP-dependent Clp protease ATP-binding subunit ClpA